ncbi:MAG: apolipoprotein N-acyltransferase [Proteobacteria bacterium]|nr:apolipoprotein N-acyltransferase [Pseudomonadota bacterium]
MRLGIILIAFFLGALSPLAFYPEGYSFFLLAILALWLELLFRQKTGKMALGVGLFFGLGFFLVGVVWIYISLHVYGGMPVYLAALCLILFVFLLALYWMIAARMIWSFRNSPALQLIAVPSVLGLMDWLRGTLFTGFPWLSLGYSQIPSGWFRWIDPILGIYGTSFLIGLVALLIRLVFVSGWSRRALMGLTGLVLFSFGMNQVSYTHPQGSPFSVRLIQGNIPQSIKWEPDQAQKTLKLYQGLVDASHEQLIILPETAFPVFSSMLPMHYLSAMANHLRQTGSTLLYGVPEQDGKHFYNSVMTLGVAPTQIYRKHHLVPFGEFIPLKFIFKPLMAWVNIPLDSFNRGRVNQPPIVAAGQKIAVDICYEDNFGNEIRQSLPQASVLVNETDDAWFGHDYAAFQHLQISQARALENGRYMLRATNTGMTAIINEHGRVLSRLPPDITGSLVGMAQGYAGMTPYSRFGDRPVIVLSGILVLLAFFWRKKA